ncbi:hypothetical protein [uncultured Williamsia sp.]|uniref:hypothetical protein n=1 Tax=uncultured Williamsia sp. TaxID=259311 RepID=UPI00261CC2B4|nr:hypothetical protein [uncultured Williamsia sp.]
MTSELPPPNGFQPKWNPYSLKAVAGLLMFTAFGVFFAFLSVRAVVETRWPYLLFYVPAAVVCLIPTLLIGRVRPGADSSAMQEFTAEHGDGELRLQRELGATVGLIAVSLIATLGCATFSIGVWTGSLEFDLSRRQHGSFPVLVAMLGLFFASVAIATALRGTSGWLALTPTEIDFMEWGISRRRIAWDEIADMTLTPQQKKKRDRMYSPSRAWLLKKGPQKRPTSIAINWPMGNRAAFWLIHFYWSHPELRDELADDRVVDRIAAGRILDEVA